MRRSLLIVAALILAALGVVQIRAGLFNLFPGSGDVDVRAAAADAGKAASQLSARAKDSFKDGNPPRESDPAVKAVLDRVFATGVLAGKTLTQADLGAVSDWDMAVVTSGLVYILAGTGTSDIAAAGTDPKGGREGQQERRRLRTGNGAIRRRPAGGHGRHRRRRQRQRP